MPTGHVFIATSLDGFIARKDGTLDWLILPEHQGEDHGYDDFIRNIDAIVMVVAAMKPYWASIPGSTTSPCLSCRANLPTSNRPKLCVARSVLPTLARARR